MEEKKTCWACNGEKGEWIDRKDPRNSTYLQDNDEDEFIPCSACNGEGFIYIPELINKPLEE